MPARTLALVLAGVLTALTGLLIAGHGPWAGPPVLALSPSHGLNLGDIPVLGLWGLGLLGCAALWRSGAPPS
ncbi:hypothetical protein [Nocardioides marmotae]|uniref:hypothetical protein n=1 Tax=Nocardioides marmotae TaxID=2663857 RepID=UPI0012B584AD|nr:hypothetical protein [Nocardioides marmotae]MBC9735617.1 hypothetical protein [Nocardioides marmotae]MTB86713.1 hypothetical protein [Nocardioides marmotae]